MMKMEHEMKIIDGHVHLVQCIAGTGAGGELRFAGNGMAEYASGERFRMLPDEFSQGVVTAGDILRKMDDNGVEKAVLLQGNYFGFQNLYSMEAVKKYPDRFCAAASYDPFCRGKEQIRKHLFKELGFPIVKFEVSTGSGLMANHFTLPLDGDIMKAEYDYADEHGLVFVIDIGKCGSESWQTDRLLNVIKEHPGMKFVVCHLLAVSMRDEDKLVDGLKKLALPNVWFDLAALPHNCGPDAYPYPNAVRYLRHGIEIAGADKLIFGTDIPSVLKEDSYQHFIQYITCSDAFSREEKERIMYRNAEHVYFK